jgi:hypothetical protein
MEWYGYIIVVMVIILLFWLYIGMQIAISIVLPKVRRLDVTAIEENERDSSLMMFYHEHLTKTYQIQSQHDYPLQVYEMIKDVKIKKFVVISHGYTYSHHGSIKYAKMMMNLGYNIIMYDHRFHGASGGKNSTLGYFEKDDLKQVIDHIFNTYGQDIYLGTYGESMGSSTCLLEQAEDERVRFVISDAGFSRLKPLISREIMKKKLPVSLFYGIANVFVWLMTHANLNKVNPIEAIKDSTIPMLFVHGKQDDFIPYQDSIDMYKSYQGPKQLFLADYKAFHARSYYFNQEKYNHVLKEFIDHLSDD